MKKIKVFLGGYINYTNAQNLNCKAVAKYLDKERFQSFALTNYFGSKDKFNIDTFNCFKPFSISKHIGFFWGIMKCDIAYLPKHIDSPLWVLNNLILPSQNFFLYAGENFAPGTSKVN